MSDVFTKSMRSAVMSRIRGAGNNDTELRLIVLMRAAGIRGWRRSVTLRFTVGRRTTEGGERTSGSAAAGIGADQRRLAFPSEAARRQATALQVRGTEAARRRATALQVVVRPDFVFPKHRLAVFVDGCFWHGCPKHATWPKHNAAFWRAKIEGNMARDRLQNRLLRRHGWKVLRIWEHALKPKQAGRPNVRIQNALLASRSRVVPGKDGAPAGASPVFRNRNTGEATCAPAMRR